MRATLLFFPLFLILSMGAPKAIAAHKKKAFQSPPASQITVSNVSYSQTAPDKFLVAGNLQNPNPESREVVARAQLAFYDQTAPKGDLPVFVLRKDTTLILKPGESRSVELPLINEGNTPRNPLRIEPMLRVRRQRIWNY